MRYELRVSAEEGLIGGEGLAASAADRSPARTEGFGVPCRRIERSLASAGMGVADSER